MRTRGRLLLVATIVGLAVAGVGSLTQAQGVDAPVLLNDSAAALAPAERIILRKPPVPAGKLLFPVDPGDDCYILDNFGDGRDGETRLHDGVDIMGSAGREVYAVASGTLTKRYTNTGTAGWGWILYDPATKTTFRYFHLAEDARGLIEGATVRAGDIIGFVGSSGTSSATNIHLHFEVRPGNVAVDPLPLLFIDTKACRVSPPIR
ncbi:MAG TPA: M23 family metallopeptidase [Ilumatobacteraceae bacterium]|nr:M23 family metallopeptidase [Ilumatobacteraceae bacterium]